MMSRRSRWLRDRPRQAWSTEPRDRAAAFDGGVELAGEVVQSRCSVGSEDEARAGCLDLATRALAAASPASAEVRAVADEIAAIRRGSSSSETSWITMAKFSSPRRISVPASPRSGGTLDDLTQGIAICTGSKSQ